MTAVGHLNVGMLVAPADAPEVAEFWDNVDRVNSIAARWPGFRARLPFDETDAALVATLFDKPDPARVVATLSVWDSAEALRDFATRGVHGRFLGRRAEWFVPVPEPTYAIWPIRDGHSPDTAEGVAAIRKLRREGPSAEAFDFASIPRSGQPEAVK